MEELPDFCNGHAGNIGNCRIGNCDGESFWAQARALAIGAGLSAHKTFDFFPGVVGGSRFVLVLEIGYNAGFSSEDRPLNCFGKFGKGC